MNNLFMCKINRYKNQSVETKMKGDSRPLIKLMKRSIFSKQNSDRW